MPMMMMLTMQRNLRVKSLSRKLVKKMLCTYMFPYSYCLVWKIINVGICYSIEFFFFDRLTILLKEDHSVCIKHEHRSVNNYKEIDTYVRPKSLIKLTREVVEEVKPQARNH